MMSVTSLTANVLGTNQSHTTRHCDCLRKKNRSGPHREENEENGNGQYTFDTAGNFHILGHC